MILYADGIELLTIPTSDNTSGDLDVSFDGGDSWEPLEKPTPTTGRCRIAGPTATDPPGDAIVLQLGIYIIFVRFQTADETIIRRLDQRLRVIPIPEEV